MMAKSQVLYTYLFSMLTVIKSPGLGNIGYGGRMMGMSGMPGMSGYGGMPNYGGMPGYNGMQNSGLPGYGGMSGYGGSAASRFGPQGDLGSAGGMRNDLQSTALMGNPATRPFATNGRLCTTI